MYCIAVLYCALGGSTVYLTNNKQNLTIESIEYIHNNWIVFCGENAIL